MTTSLDLQQFMDKIKTAEKGHHLDLSIGEDLSIGIMNLIAIEEHLLFTGNKTGDTKYFELLSQAREMRKELLKDIIKDPEGEVWCTSKHLLAASMRLFEVGTKYQSKGDKTKAYDLFKKSYDLYNLFWAINLDMIKSPLSKVLRSSEGRDLEGFDKTDQSLDIKKSDFMGRVSGVIGKILDCCRE